MNKQRPKNISPKDWAQIQKDSNLIVDTFDKHGVIISSIYDLPTKDLPKFIPILIDLYEGGKITSRMKGSLLQMIWNSRKVPGTVQTLVKWFKEAEPGSEEQWQIGSCIDKHSTPEDFESIVKLIQKKKYGKARQMLAYALVKTKHEGVTDILLSLLDDTTIDGHVVDALSKIKTKDERIVKKVAHFAEKENEPRTWVRNAAKKAIERQKSIS